MAEPLGARAWAAAQDLIGVRFRLHGRDPATGLDCVGLVAAAYAAAGFRPQALPSRYRISGPALADATAWLQSCGAQPTGDPAEAGDIALVDLSRAGRAQLHLLLLGPAGAVHAHAGLGRVVLSPPPLAPGLRWRIVARERE